jgi:CRISPR-associated protein Csx10
VPILKVIITATAPLVFSERRPDGQFRQSTPYVPGAVIRGALAQQFIDAGDEKSDDFRTLFTKDDAPLFRNAYPGIYDVDESGSVSISSHLLPATAYTCKTEEGFKRHGVFDSLIDRLCCEEMGVKIPYLPRCNHPGHKGEGGRVEACGGFYAESQNIKRRINVPFQLTTRVALNRQRKTSEEGMLYSPLVISESTIEGDVTTFLGSIVVNDHTRSIVKSHLPELTHIGSGVARGFGRVEVKVEEMITNDISKRLKTFNDLVKGRWALWQQLPHEQESTHLTDAGTFFTVMLSSDAILRADGWTPTVRLEPEMLGAAGANATLLRCYTTAEYRGGWNTAWRLPKNTELVARMGSVYVYHTTNKAEDENWLKALRELEQFGTGERCIEGFGQVLVCDDFHQVIQEMR